MPPSASSNRPGALAHRAGKRAARVAEQLRLAQVVGERRAVDGAERPQPSRTQAVNLARDQFLAAAALAFDQHGERHARGGLHGGAHVGNGLADAEQARRLGTDGRPAGQLDRQAHGGRHGDGCRLEQRALGSGRDAIRASPNDTPARRRRPRRVARPRRSRWRPTHMSTTVCPRSAARCASRGQVVVAQAGQRDRAVRGRAGHEHGAGAAGASCSSWQTPGSAARGSSCAWHARRTATRSSSMGGFSPSEGAGHADTRACPATRARALVPRATRATSSSICGRSAARPRPARGRAARARGPAARRRAASAHAAAEPADRARRRGGGPVLRPAPAPGRRRPATVDGRRRIGVASGDQTSAHRPRRWRRRSAAGPSPRRQAGQPMPRRAGRPWRRRHRRSSSRGQTRASTTCGSTWRARRCGVPQRLGQRACQHRHVTSSATQTRRRQRASSTREAPSAECSRYSASTSAAWRIHCSATSAAPSTRQATCAAGASRPASRHQCRDCRRSPRAAASREASTRSRAQRQMRVAGARTPMPRAARAAEQRRFVPRRNQARAFSRMPAGSTSAARSRHVGRLQRPVRVRERSGRRRADPAVWRRARQRRRAVRWPTRQSARARSHCGEQHPGDTHSARASSLGRQRLQRVRGADEAGRAARRPARRCPRDSAPPSRTSKPRQSLAIRQLPARRARAAPAGRTRRAAPATTCDGRPSRRTADSSTAACTGT